MWDPHPKVPTLCFYVGSATQCGQDLVFSCGTRNLSLPAPCVFIWDPESKVVGTLWFEVASGTQGAGTLRFEVGSATQSGQDLVFL